MRYFDIIFDGTQKLSGSVGPTMQWNGKLNTSLFGRHLSMKPQTPGHHKQQINWFWLINWNYKIQHDSEDSRPFQGFQELMCPSLTQALLFQSKVLLCSTVRSYYKMAWFYGYALSAVYHKSMILIFTCVKFAKSRAILAYMPRWSTCRRAYVPTYQKCTNFSLLCVYAPINVPTRHAPC